MNGEQTRFKEGNTASLKYTKERAVEILTELIKRAKSNEWYSLQEIILENEDLIPYASFYYIIDKFPDLEIYKKQLHSIVIAKINKGAIKGDMNPTACIWRMKQLGEKDKQEIDRLLSIRRTSMSCFQKRAS